ncbi:MAG: ATP-dependent DNA helicase RecG [Candidatus Saccharimonas sp.]
MRDKMNLATNLDQIKGVGPKTALQLKTAGFETVGDLLEFLPRKYEDFTHLATIAELQPGKVTIKAVCESISTKRVRRGLQLTTAVLADDSGKLNAVWFNQPYRTTQLNGSKEEFYFSGEFEYNYGRYQLTNPSAELAKDLPVQTEKLMPVYHAVRGLKTQLVRKVIKQLRPLMSVLPESLPASIIEKEKLIDRAKAISIMHFPESQAETDQARQRLAFEELFELLLASQLNKRENQKLAGYHIPFEVEVVKQFVAKLPFQLTGAQRRAAWDILQDFERQTPMNRLLQGDVGSGKTVVAGLAMRQAASHGYQSALMAPTEILANQHAETLQSLLTPFGVTVGLLTGRVKGKAREQLYAEIAGGNVDVVVGTHALIQKTVDFHKLGFVVIDEQHRFGVEQRQKLLSKSGTLPHLLSMTATPIPRSLALTVYGELDISVIDQSPAGRLPIKTKIVSPISRAATYKLIDQQISEGRQAYVICSLIDDSYMNDLKSVQAEFKRLKNSVFGHRAIGLLHGKLKSAEKEQVMQEFKDGKLDILVSTTVVEVGVDVPNATAILIEDAEQFGLAQLHQLRGRVGRRDFQSYCYLMMGSTAKPSQRLRELEKSNDGFYLAEADMKLRGPGEIYGRRQSGDLNLKIATLADTKLISQAQKAAVWFIDSGEDLANYPSLQNQVLKYQRLTTLN